MSGEISAIGKTGEIFGTIYDLINNSSDLLDEIKKCIESGKFNLPDSYFSTLGTITTIVNTIKPTAEGIVYGGVFSFAALIHDIDILIKAISKKEDDARTDEIIITTLSIVADIANIVAICPAPQVKIIAIAVSLLATSIKELYVHRKEIYSYIKDLGNKTNQLKQRYRTDMSVYLDLPNSAIRCHVINGLYMNRGLMRRNSFSLNRLQPQFLPAKQHEHHSTMADELRRKFNQKHPNYAYEYHGPDYLRPDFEWKRPNFEWRTNRR
jgi:hypothetical protein